MKNNYTLQAIATLILLFILTGTATAQHKFKNVNKVKSFVTRTVPSHEGYMDVILLDSVISDNKHIYCEYNNFGYITAKRTYTGSRDYWYLETNSEKSYIAEYTFDEQNRCTAYSKHCYNRDGSKGQEIYRAEVEYTDNRRCERHYYADAVSNYEDVEAELFMEIIYDKFGNPTIFKEYEEYDSYNRKPILTNYTEYRFTGCAISYDECENGNYALDYDDELFEKYCYYEVEWSRNEQTLTGRKKETSEDGSTITYIIVERDFPASELGNIDNYWQEEYNYEYPDYDNTQPAAKVNINDFETGGNRIYFTEGDWMYMGFIEVEEMYDAESGTYKKEITNGKIIIEWLGNHAYSYPHPSENYQSPVGINAYEFSSLSNIADMNVVSAYWDYELKTFVTSNNRDYYTFKKHYPNDKGQVIEETLKYCFNGETIRMELVPGATITTTYSYDDTARLTTIEYTNNTTHFEYLDGTNYPQKEYTTDAQGNESNVCTYYYSIGKYLWPVTNATDIEEVSATGIVINGNHITADGKINVFTTSGSLVASGKDNITINGKGLYIVETGGSVHKFFVK